MDAPPVPNPPIAGSKPVTDGAFTMQAAPCGDRLGISGPFRETLATERPHMRQREHRGEIAKPLPLPSRRVAKAPRLTFHSRESSKPHARPPAPRTDRQPHRRRRSGRTSCERGQGTGGKRHRRRRQPDRHLHRWRRPAADRHHRRRQRHDPWRSGAIGRPPRHLEARRRGSVADPHAGVSRRGAALDRRGGQTRHHHAPSQRAACLVAGGGRRREIRDHAGGAVARAPASRSAISSMRRRRG